MIKTILNYYLVKDRKKEILALSKALEKVAKSVDLYMIAKYRGYDVYACSKEEYLKHRDEYDKLDKVLLLNDQSLLIYRGKVIGKIKDIDGNIEALPQEEFKV